MSTKAISTQAELIANFFERFLPEHIGSLGLSEMDSFTTTFGFVIDDLPDGHWTLRFEHGTLIETPQARSPEHQDESFSYHMNGDAFWMVVGGQDDPRNVFLSGHAEIEGDVENALKAGMVLAQFSQMHPYPKPQADGGIIHE